MEHSHHGHSQKTSSHSETLSSHQHTSAHEKNKTTHSGHDKHAGHHTSDFLKRFWICVIVTIPILLLSHMIQELIGFEISFTGSQFVLVAASTFIYIYGGAPFLVGMVREIKNKATGMMTLVAIAITVAFFYSIAVVFGLEGMDFFWELATLIDIMLLGHWLEMRSQMAASRALESLVDLLPSEISVWEAGIIKPIKLQELKNGNILIVKPGEKIAADGLVIDGNSFVNESLLTGESLPVKKQKDDKVIAGSLNENGSLQVKATGVGKDSYLNKVIALVQSAQNAKSSTQNLADRVAKWLTIISLLIGTITFIYWYSSGGNLSYAMERFVTVMVTACPHALGVAIPLVVAISTTKAAMNGLLIRNRTAFEGARKLTTIIFDKTGTLTKGSHEIQRIISINDKYNQQDILQYASAVQQYSEHYLAKGIMQKVAQMKLPVWPSTDFNSMQGIGVSGLVNGKKVVIAGPNYFLKENLKQPEIPTEIDQSIETVNYILINDIPAGIISFADTIREGSKEAIQELKEMGIKTFLLTGDNEKIAKSVSNALGMDGYMANVLPHQKQDKVKEFQMRGEIVGMTGDGVNDAPALAQADVGIAVGSGTDVAAETADIILINSDPKDVANIISFGKATYRKMVENLFWAVGYNVIAIPLAAGILYPDFVLSPALGAVLMSSSTIIVAFNAQLLRKKFK